MFEHRRGAARALAERRVVGRHVAPAEDDLALLDDDGFDQGDDLGLLRRITRQEDEAGAVVAGGWQRDAQRRRHLAEKGVRKLNEDARTVTSVGFAAAGTAVLEVPEELEALLDDGPGALAFQVHHEADTARRAFVLRVVESLRIGCAERAPVTLLAVVLHRRAPGEGDGGRHVSPDRRNVLTLGGSDAAKGNRKV